MRFLKTGFLIIGVVFAPILAELNYKGRTVITKSIRKLPAGTVIHGNGPIELVVLKSEEGEVLAQAFYQNAKRLDCENLAQGLSELQPRVKYADEAMKYIKEWKKKRVMRGLFFMPGLIGMEKNDEKSIATLIKTVKEYNGRLNKG